MSDDPIRSKLTLEDISVLKERKKREIEKQQELINARVRNIFAPIEPATTKAESLVRTFNTGMAVYDGLMLGMKTFGRIKRFLRRHHK